MTTGQSSSTQTLGPLHIPGTREDQLQYLRVNPGCMGLSEDQVNFIKIWIFTAHLGLQTHRCPRCVNTWHGQSGAHNSTGDHGSLCPAPVYVHLHTHAQTCIHTDTQTHTQRHPCTMPNLSAESQLIVKEPDSSCQIITGTY